MVANVVRLGASAVGGPLGALWDAWRRVRTGSHAVLEVTISPAADLEAREAFLHRLRRVARDSSVDAVLFKVDGPLGGWAANQDLRGAIALLRAAGKATYAMVEAPGNAAYAIATACDRVFAVPTGELNLVGVGVELTFFGAALERLGVRPDFEAAGAYKSFGEPFTRTFASPENLEAVEALVDDLHRQLVADIARDRCLTPERVQALLDVAPIPAEHALRDGLVDELLYDDQLTRWLEEHHGPGVRGGKKAKRVPFAEWALRDSVAERLALLGRGGGTVAVVHLEGGIVMEDKSPSTRIRARTVVPLLAKLREDDDVSAVVLHVSSPGGGVLPSDLIWREVDELRKTKPVVASFEDVAASGGFYISAPANEIVARAGTLTGSIGVFGGKLVLGDALRKVGVTSQPVLAGENAALFSPGRRFTDPQRARFKAMLQRTYDGFVERVAAGRDRPVADVEPDCRGRVWTGQHALDRKLVDRIGTLDDAVARARTLAGLPAHARRVDHSGQPRRSLLSRLAQDALRGAVPQLARAGLLGSIARLAGPDSPVAALRALARLTELVDVVALHEGEALALLPFDASPR